MDRSEAPKKAPMTRIRCLLGPSLMHRTIPCSMAKCVTDLPSFTGDDHRLVNVQFSVRTITPGDLSPPCLQPHPCSGFPPLALGDHLLCALRRCYDSIGRDAHPRCVSSLTRVPVSLGPAVNYVMMIFLVTGFSELSGSTQPGAANPHICARPRYDATRTRPAFLGERNQFPTLFASLNS